MDYDALMAFAVFADHRNFTKAARKLYISQPALHQKVNKLADQLDTQLYVRDGRELLLTEEGELLAEHARRVDSMTEDVLGQIREDRRRSPVRLASGPGAFLHLLGPAIRKAREGRFPLRFMTMRAPDAAAAVSKARAHVAVGVFPGGVDDLAVEPWREVGQQVVVPEDHRLADRRRLKPEDIDGEALVIAPEGKPHRISTARVLDEHDVSWTVGVEAMGWALMMQFVSYGMGVAIINDFVPPKDGLVGIPITDFPTITYSVAIRPDARFEGTRWLFELILSDDS